MTPTGRVGRAVVVGTLAAALAACGSGGDGGEPTNGLDELPAEQIERRAAEAAHEARSVQLSGTVLTDGRSYRLDVRLTAEGAVGVRIRSHCSNARAKSCLIRVRTFCALVK